MWPKGGRLCQKITAFNSRVRELGARAWEDTAVDAALVEEGDQLMAEALEAMLAGQEVLNSVSIVGLIV